MRSTNPIMLLEDDIVDAMTIKRALKEIGIHNEVVHFENGEKALEHLKEDSSSVPAIILLDLNMPIMNGLEFLEERIKSSELLMIPVVVLTTSNYGEDKLRSFRLSISGYMVKPVDYTQFVDVIKTIDSYWTMSETADEY